LHSRLDREILQQLSDDARIVLSEPVGDLPRAWSAVPDARHGVAGHGEDELRAFAPKPPAKAIPVSA
jgi:glutamine amidotransferase